MTENSDFARERKVTRNEPRTQSVQRVSRQRNLKATVGHNQDVSRSS